MNTKIILILSFLTIVLTWNLASGQTGSPAEFIGSDGNWFMPSNWSTGLVPDAATDVLLRGGALAVLDGTGGTPSMANLRLEDEAQIILSGGVLLRADAIELFDLADIESYASRLEAGSVTVTATAEKAGSKPGGWGGFSLNPSCLVIDEGLLLSGLSVLRFGIGGTTPAAPGTLGPGHYAAISADSVVLDGTLETELLYGFTPAPGDTFTLISAVTSLTGQFVGLPEGTVLTRTGEVSLRISYTGGDGNDVELRAVSNTAEFIGSDGDWFMPSNWSTGLVPDAATDVLLRDGALAVLDGTGGTPSMANLRLEDEAQIILSGGVLLRADDIELFDLADIESYASRLESGSVTVTATAEKAGSKPGGLGGFRLNPSCQVIDEDLRLSGPSVLRFGIGGTTPATPGTLGPGHYATISADSVVLDGTLETELLYGFTPAPGDTFTLISAVTTLTGQFVGLPEGAVAARFSEVELTISYAVNAVVLNASAIGNEGEVVVEGETTTEGEGEYEPGLEADVAPRPSGDGALVVNDWVQAGRFVAGLDTPVAGNEFQRADCAPFDSVGDGQLLVNDWVQAGRYVAGLDVPQPAGGPETLEE